MKADGTGTSVKHVRILIQSEGAVRTFSVLSVAYSGENSTGSIDHVLVHKPDGTATATPATDAMELPAPVTREAPLYSDLKEKQLPVRSLAVGDTLEYDLSTVYAKAEAPNQFWGAEHFIAAGNVVLAETLTLEVPSSKYIQVWSPHHTPQISEKDGVKQWKWSASQLRPTSAKTADGKPDLPHDPDEDDDGRALPSVAWTTFHNWAEVGDWYRSLALERAQPNDALRAQAEALTKDAKTPEAQVQALYYFVSTNMRYVGIDLGAGRYQPHFASATLANRYGDCKDKDTLLEALLRARGFKTAPALIGAGIAPVQDLPSPAIFNHVITTVELPASNGQAASRLWLDATPGFSPYRVLLPPLRDQQALRVPADAPASLEHTPSDPPYVAHESFLAEATLDNKGLLTGHVTLEARSDTEFALRAAQQSVAPAQWDQAAQYFSNAMGFTGTVSNSNLRQTDPAQPVHMTWDYRRPEFADWANLRILPLFPALEITAVDKEKAPEHDIQLGTPRTVEAVTRIKLPESYRPNLPDATHVKRSYSTYDQSYSFSDGTLTVRRSLAVLQRKVPKAEWKDYYAYTASIGLLKGEDYIQLAASESEPASKGEKASGQLNNPTSQSASADSVRELMAKADQQYRTNDVKAERETLLQIKAQAPDTPYLWSMLGYLAMKQGQLSEGIEDVKHELKNHPEDHTNIPILLSNMYVQAKRYDDAIALLKTYDSRDDVSISNALSRAYLLKNEPAQAAEVLLRATEKHPENRGLKNGYASALHKAGHDTEAAEVSRKNLEGAEDPNELNSAAYVLAQIGTDLPLAETAARKAVSLLEDRTGTIHVTEANDAAFASTSLLLATYDTLAYILLREHRAAEAEPYQRAAWFARPDITVGDHLAQILEATGKPDEAATIDELALKTDNAFDMSQEDYGEVVRNLGRLQQAKSHSHAGSAIETLQAMRTFHVPRPGKVQGSGTFRVQLGAGGIVESDLVNGSPEVRQMSVELQKIPMKDALPPTSKAKLLRDGVLHCSTGATCEFVFMPNSGLWQEAVH